MERYQLTQLTDGRYQCTDTATTLVCTFIKGEFNETQEMHFEEMPKDLMAVPTICNEMSQWLMQTHPELVSPSGQIDSMRIRIGERLQEERLDEGLSIKDASILSGLTPYNIKRIEEGEDNYTIDALIRYATALGCNLFDVD